MKKTNQNNHSEGQFLKDNPNKNGLSKSHQKYLGYTMPEDFFKESKQDILDSLKDNNPKRIQRRSHFILRTAAAVLALLLITTAYLYINDSFFFTNTEITAESIESDELDFLFNTAILEDDELDTYIDEYLMEDIIAEAELEDNHVIINSLMMDDAEADEYLDNYLIEKLVL